MVTMPESHADDSKNGPRVLCRRCGVLDSKIIVRTEPLCRDCFVKYVHTKVIKRLEAFRVRQSTFGQDRKLLLPLSLGASSLTLLHVLSHHLSRQLERSGRPGFALVVVLVQEPSLNGTSWQDKLGAIQKLYPLHSYFPTSLPNIVDVKDFQADTNNTLEIEHDDQGVSKAHLEELLELLPSATSRADVLAIMRTRVIAEMAKKHGCESVLWGDSTTRLAERTLAETAKGRGFSLPWQVADGKSPHGVAFHFPMCDLLKKEILAHANMSEPPLNPLMIEDVSKTPSASFKNLAIDDLMKQYFESVEESYPSIVANVVKTSGKLEAPALNEETRSCKICRMPVVDSAFGLHGWGGDQTTIPNSGDEQLCYGCARAMRC